MKTVFHFDQSTIHKMCSSSDWDIVVVGGGLIGTACARHLTILRPGRILTYTIILKALSFIIYLFYFF